MTGNRTVFYVMGVLAVLLVIVGTVADSSKKPPPKSFLQGGSFRAVVVPTDRPRTVVVTPCDAPAPTTGQGALQTPGVTTVRFGAGPSPRRTVLVPRCAA